MSQQLATQTNPADVTVAPVRARKPVWRWLRLFVLSLVLLLSSILALLGSSAGLQLLWLLQPHVVPALHISALSGDLWQGIRVNQLQYQDDGVALSIAEVSLQVELRCLWQRQVCLPHLELKQLALQLPEPAAQSLDNADNADNAEKSSTQGSPEAITETSSALQMPFGLNITRFAISDSTLQLGTQQIRIGSLQTAVDLTAQQLTLSGLILAQSSIVLANPIDNPNHTDNTPISNPLLPLLQLQLPFALAMPALQLRDLTVQQGKEKIVAVTAFSSDIELNDRLWRFSNSQGQLGEPALRFSADLALDLQAQQLALTSTVTATDAAWPEPLQLSLSGQGALATWLLEAKTASPLPLALTLHSNLQSPTLDFKATLQAEALRWPLQQIPKTGAARDNSPASSQLSQFSQLSQLRGEISGDLQAQQIAMTVTSQSPTLPSADWTLRASHHAGMVELQQLQLKTLNGQIDLQATLALANLELQAALQVTGIQPGLFWADYPGDLSGNIKLNGGFAANSKTRWQLHATELAITGDLRNHPLLLQGQLSLQQPTVGLLQLQTPGLKLQHGQNSLTLEGALAEQLTLDAKLHIADLAYSLALAEGSIDAELQLRGDAKQPDLLFSIRGNDMSYLDEFSLGEITAKAHMPALGDKPSQISVVAKNGQAPGWQIQQIDWQSEGSRSQHQTHLTFDSHQLKAVLAMQAGIKKQQWHSTVQEFHLQSDMGDWQLQQPWQVMLDLAKDQAKLGPACWLEAKASVCIAQTPLLSAKQGALSLQLSEVALNNLDSVLPPNLSLEGLVSGQAALNWQNGRLDTVSWQLSSTAGLVRHQLTTPLDLPWQQLTLSGALKQQQLTSKIQAALAKDSAIALDLKINDLLQATPTIQANLQLAPLSLAFLQPVFNEFTKFDGLLSANMRADGALHNPALYGTVTIDALQLTGQQAPLELQKANVLASFRGFAASLNSHWQTPEGKLSLTGEANWLQPDAWFSQLELQGQQLKLQLMDADLTISPQLTFTASPHSGQLSGNIDIPAGDIRVNSLPENATQVSDDEIVITAAQQRGTPSRWKFSSDLRLKIGEQVRLAAFGLRTRLQGDLRVRQQGMTPSLHGQVQLKDGSFRAYGQDLTLRKGRLTFNGPARSPLLAIEAIRNPEKTEDNVIAGLRVNGVADNPQVEAFSEPAMPQANALAYLLMGRNIGSSAGDGAVTTGLIGIGIANSGRLVGALGEAFGISDLSLDTAGSGDQSKVTVSGYLSPRLQVKYGVGIFTQFGEFTLRYRLMQQVYVEAVQSLATSVDLLYKMEFD